MKRLSLLFAVSVLQAADLSGIWVGQIALRNNQFSDVAFKLVQQGDRVTGKLYDDYRSTPILEGRATGESCSFLVIATEQAGNQINETRHRFTGTLSGEELEISRVRESSSNAGNGGVVQFKGDTTTKFRLKRLL